MMEDLFDDIIKQKAIGHEAAVPPDAWDNISKKKKKRRYPFWWWLPAVLLLGGTGAFLIYNNHPSRDVSNTVTQTVFQKDETTNRSIQKDESKPVMNDRAHGGEIAEGSGNSGKENNDLANTNTVAGTESAGSQKHAQKQIQKPSSEKKGDAFAAKNKVKSKPNDKQSILSPTPGNIASSEKNSGGLPIPEGDRKSIKAAGEVIAAKEGADMATTSSDSIEAVAKVEENKEAAALKSVAASKKVSGTQEESGKNSKWELEMSIMPIFPIEKNDKVEDIKRTQEKNGAVTDFTASNIKTSLEPSLAYQIGVKRKINKKLTVGIGFQYAKIYEKVHLSGIETRTDSRVVQRLNYGSAGPYLTLDTLNTQFSYNLEIDALNSYKNYSIPLSVQYNFLDRKGWSMGLDAGFYFNISATYQNNINGALETQYTSGEKQSTKLKNQGVDFFAGLRVSRSLSDDLQLFIMPMYRCNLTKYDMSNAVVRKYINQAGISFGFAYKIN